MHEDYSLLELCDVSVRSYANGRVILVVSASRPGYSDPVARGQIYTGEDRLETAADDACSILCGWAAVGELGIAKRVADWPVLPS